MWRCSSQCVLNDAVATRPATTSSRINPRRRNAQCASSAKIGATAKSTYGATSRSQSTRRTPWACATRSEIAMRADITTVPRNSGDANARMETSLLCENRKSAPPKLTSTPARYKSFRDPKPLEL